MGNPEETKQMAIDEPVNFAFEVLTSFGGSFFWTIGRIKLRAELFLMKSIKVGGSGKKKIRADRRFLLPSKRNLPLNCEKRMFSTDALVIDFNEAKDVKAKISILESILKDLSVFDDPGSQLNELIASISPLFVVAFRRSVASAVELLIARDDLISKIDGIDLVKELIKPSLN